MKTAILVICLMLAGCAGIMGNTPTFEYCPEFHYNRTGNQIEITAKCAAPIGGGALPLPVLPVK